MSRNFYSLKERIDSLREGDRARAHFRKASPRRGEYEYVVTGLVTRPGNTPWVGGFMLKNIDALLSVEILERAKQPFYTNSDREPRVGDVGQWVEARGRDGHYVYAGKLWFAIGYLGWREFSRGQLALVDPSELEDSSGR